MIFLLLLCSGDHECVVWSFLWLQMWNGKASMLEWAYGHAVGYFTSIFSMRWPMTSLLHVHSHGDYKPVSYMDMIHSFFSLWLTQVLWEFHTRSLDHTAPPPILLDVSPLPSVHIKLWVISSLFYSVVKVIILRYNSNPAWRRGWLSWTGKRMTKKRIEIP